MGDHSLDQYAASLFEAVQSHKTIPPLRDSGLSSVDDAYAIQELNIRRRVNQGARIIGKKVGLTSFSVQKQLGIGEPDFGSLMNDMEVLSGHSISMSQLMQPKAEAEIAFVLAEDIDTPAMTLLEFLPCIEYMLASIEIVGSRIADWNIKLVDTVADNASASHFVLGHLPKTLDEVDVIQAKMKMWKNGEVVSEGDGSACMGSPLNAALWLANKMSSFGSPLRAGDLILSGALGPMTNIAAGDDIRAEIEGLGIVSVSFED